MPVGFVRKRFIQSITTTAIVAHLLALALRAEAPAAASALSLDEAVATALKQNWDQRSSDRDVAIAAAQKRIAAEYPNPNFAYETTNIHRNATGNLTGDGSSLWSRSYDTVCTLSQPIEIGGKRSARRESAEANFAAAQAVNFDARRTRTLDVTRAYTAALLADLSASVAADSSAHLRQEADLANVRFQAGDIAASDVDQLRIAADQLELQAERAQADARAQRIALELLLGQTNPRGEIQLRDSLEDLARRDAEIEASGSAARRPDVAAAEENVRKAEADLRTAKAQRTPNPTLLLEFEHQPPDANQTFGVGVSFDLPIWTRYHGEIRSAALAREQAQLSLAKTQAQATADLLVARDDRAVAVAQWKRYEQQLRPTARRVLDSVSIAYQKGGASLVDLLEAQRSDNDIRQAWASAAAAVVIAHAEWIAATSAYPEH